MSPEKTKEYVEHRLRLLGWTGNLTVANSATTLIHAYTAGTQKAMEELCDTLLSLRKLTKHDTITRVIVKMAIDDQRPTGKLATQGDNDSNKDRELLSIEQLAMELAIRMRSPEKEGAEENNVLARRFNRAYDTFNAPTRPQTDQPAQIQQLQLNEGKPTILVVDDSLTVRTIITSALSQDFICVEACDGKKGWDALLNNAEIKLAILDLAMPVLDGYGLIKRVRASDSAHIATMPLIVVTADKDTGAKKEAYLAGANDFITKATDPFDLLVRVRTYYQLTQAQRELEEVREETASKEKADRSKAEQEQARPEEQAPIVETIILESSAETSPVESDVPILMHQVPRAAEIQEKPPEHDNSAERSTVESIERANGKVNGHPDSLPTRGPSAHKSRYRSFLRKVFPLQSITTMALVASVSAVLVVTGIVAMVVAGIMPPNRSELTGTGESTDLIQADTTMHEEQSLEEQEQPIVRSQQLASKDWPDTSADMLRHEAAAQELRIGARDEQTLETSTANKNARQRLLSPMPTAATKLAGNALLTITTVGATEQQKNRSPTQEQTAKPSIPISPLSYSSPVAKLTKDETPASVTSSSKDAQSTTTVALASKTPAPIAKEKKRSSPKEQKDNAQIRTLTEEQKSKQEMTEAQKEEAAFSQESTKPTKGLMTLVAPSLQRTRSSQDEARTDGPKSSQTSPDTQKSKLDTVATPEKPTPKRSKELAHTSPGKGKVDVSVVAKAETPRIGTRITSAELSALLRKFTWDYQAGNLDQFMSLFAEDAQTNERSNREEIRRDYKELFRTTDLRRMKLNDIKWERGKGVAQGSGRFEVKVRRTGQLEAKTYVGNLRFRVENRGHRARITRLIHSQTKLQAISQ